MPNLDTYTTALTAETAAHLLRRATVGPTNAEITAFVGLTASQAYAQLLANVQYTPEPVIHLFTTLPSFGQPIDPLLPFDGDNNFGRLKSIGAWWALLMANQTRPPSLIEKLALFWQNHFVVSSEVVTDHRFVWRYLDVIRNNSLGNFKVFVKAITTDPAMLEYLNGNENVAGAPNENYARELQELFTVGDKDINGNANYTEDDVKEAARVLTGWKHNNYWKAASVGITSEFRLNKHDIGLKTFSANYGNATVTGNNTTNAGNIELDALVNILMAHPQAAKFICRKLYRWYINPNVSASAEANIIAPLATFFASAANNFAIEPVVQKLLTCDAFFDISNRGAIIKSPIEFAIGLLRHFNLPAPVAAVEPTAADKYTNYIGWNINNMQMPLLAQPSVFGYEPYYLTTRSKGWLSSATLGNRYQYADALVFPWLQVTPTYLLGLKLVDWVTSLQPNFSDVAGTPAVTTEQVFDSFTTNLFVFAPSLAQKNFLIDTIMMQGIPRTSWIFEWNRYRTTPTNVDNFNGINWRLKLLMKYMLRMAEIHLS
jgi:uncharacterized protein (DUF1800 family)